MREMGDLNKREAVISAMCYNCEMPANLLNLERSSLTTEQNKAKNLRYLLNL